MKELFALMETNPEVKEKVDALNKSKKAKVVDFIALAAEYGITITEEEFMKNVTDGEMSDDELEAVAGGAADGAVRIHPNCDCLSGGAGIGYRVEFGEDTYFLY